MWWETFQTLFMFGTLATVMVNTRSIVHLTRRLSDLEDEIWEYKEKNHD